MKKDTNFRIIDLNLNLIYMCLAVFVFYKCAFNQLFRDKPTNPEDSHHQKLSVYVLGIVSTIHALIAGYVGCLAVWFRSKSWTQIQVLTNTLVIPFLVLVYAFKRIRVDSMPANEDEFGEYLMIAPFAFGISLIFVGKKYVEVLRKEVTTEKTSRSPPIQEPAVSWTPMSGIFVSGSYPSLYESNWNLAPFGRMNANQYMGSVPYIPSLATSFPSINLVVNPIK